MIYDPPRLQSERQMRLRQVMETGPAETDNNRKVTVVSFDREFLLLSNPR